MNKQENWIRNDIKEQRLEIPSADFTDKIMLKLANQKFPQTTSLIPTRGWYLIGTFVLVIILLSILSSTQITNQISTISFELHRLQRSPFLAFILMIVPAFVFVQTALIKKYFNRAISW